MTLPKKMGLRRRLIHRVINRWMAKQIGCHNCLAEGRLVRTVRDGAVGVSRPQDVYIGAITEHPHRHLVDAYPVD